MFFNIELLYFVLMIGAFIALLLWAKLPSGLCLMISAVIGIVASAIISGTPFDLRYFVEGAFGYFDTILIITTAMIFMGAMQITGALEYISAVLVKAFRRVPSLLLIAFMLIIMFPAMVTGSSLASALSAGALIAPIMIKWGIPKAKAGAIVGIGSILGMVAPPVNVPAMVICDVIDIPYVGFELPLLILVIPLAIVSVLLLGRKYVKPLSEEQVDYVVNTSILKELNWTVCIPLFVLILLIVAEMIWPIIFGSFAMPLMFVVATILSFFFGRKLPFWQKKPKQATLQSDESGEVVVPQPAHETPNCVVEVVRQGVEKSFSAMGLLIGVGLFMEAITLNGVRGEFITLAVTLPGAVRYIGMGLSLPIFGGISAFGSASMLGGPFVMAFMGGANDIVLTCGFSLLAAIGEFLPPTAMSATFASQIVEEKNWTKISLAALPALVLIFVYSIGYALGIGKIVYDVPKNNRTGVELIILASVVVVAVVFLFVWELLVHKNAKLKSYARTVTADGVIIDSEGVAPQQAATEENEELIFNNDQTNEEDK